MNKRHFGQKDLMRTPWAQEVRLKKPMPITVEKIGDGFMASIDGAETYACWGSEKKAIHKLVELAIDSFYFFEHKKNISVKFGKNVEEQFEILNSYIARDTKDTCKR